MLMPISFHGAKLEYNEDDERVYTDRGEVVVDSCAVIAYYDHALVMDRHTIYVMETVDEIKKKFEEDRNK